MNLLQEKGTALTANTTGVIHQLKVHTDEREIVPQNCTVGHTFFFFFNKLVKVIFGTKWNITLRKENICLFVFPV